MTTSAVKSGSFSREQEIIEAFLSRQGKREFVRIVSEKMESVGYSPNSSVRFWYNDSMTSYDSHWHTAFEMIMPTEGQYLVTVGQQTYELSPGDIFVIPGGTLHSLRAPSRGGRFIFLFELDLIWQIKGSSYLASCVTQPILINRSTCPPIYEAQLELVNQLCRDYLENHSLRDLTIYTRLMTFFLNYGKYRMSLEGSYALTQPANTGQRNQAERFHAVFDYLDRHFAEELTLENVAALAGFSKFYFSRTFKQLSGQNFYDYLCHRRIKSAEMLLMKPGLSISQIALHSGFSSLSTFNRVFKKLNGCTPTKYRGMFQVHMDS